VSIDGCVVKVVDANRLCVSGECSDLSESTNCEINKKCVYSKSRCVVDVCQGLSDTDCEKNELCYVDNTNTCIFDMCSEESGLKDSGDSCLSLTDCGYESFEDRCMVANSKFTVINVGSIQGMV
jgi:hypothetical protein